KWNSKNNWRFSFNTDAVAASSGAKRVGVYLKAVFANVGDVDLQDPTAANMSETDSAADEYSVLTVYGQSSSLPRMSFFGIGPTSTLADRAHYSFAEQIVGTRVVIPFRLVSGHLPTGLVGEMNLRRPQIGPGEIQNVPSVLHAYTDLTAPGLRAQPRFVQFREQIQLRPWIFHEFALLNYVLSYEQYLHK